MKEHLNGTAPVPVSLFIVRTDAPHSRAKALHIHRGEILIALRRDSQLPLGRGGTTGRSYFRVRPGLGRHPRNGIVPIRKRSAEDIVIAFRKEVAAFVHLDKRVAALHGSQFRGEIARCAQFHVPVIEIVGSAHEDNGYFLRRIFRTINIGRHALSVPHGNHDFAIDNGERFEFLLNGVPAGDQLKIAGGGRLSESGQAAKHQKRQGDFHHGRLGSNSAVSINFDINR